MHTVCSGQECVCFHNGNTKKKSCVVRPTSLEDKRLIEAIRDWQNYRWGVCQRAQAS